MRNYESIKQTCKNNSKIAATVIDEFILYYAADKDKLHQIILGHLKKYKEIIQEIGQETTNKLIAQYMAHRVFKENGLIKKYLNHSAIKNLIPTEYAFLEEESKSAWKYRYSVIVGNPAPDFYEMYDVFREEEFLLYSPGTTLTFETQSPILWFNLTAFNGECWATFGPITGYNGFNEDDIFFFATELNPDIESGEELIEELEKNPIPFSMLLSNANVPRVKNSQSGEEILLHQAIDQVDSLDTESLKEKFNIAWNKDVYQLNLIGFSEAPHSAIAYYDEAQKLLMRTSLTAHGFDALSKALQHLPIENLADVLVSLPMKTCAEEILNKTIDLIPYEHLFSKEISSKEQQEMDELNDFLHILIPYVNAGEEPDLQTLAQQAKLPYQTAQDLWRIVSKHKKS
ncbi:MAG: hypothetical protein K9I36_13550 [Bacteroidia bacterium]|nr:hypothetical protein [Bacteroidia bacterium]MCF8427756.1 hypothetical protein [Bacteroidia bacterium]